MTKERRKFFIGKKSIQLSTIIFIVGTLLYLACLVIEHQCNALESCGQAVNTKWIFFIGIASDFLLVVMSVFGAAIISSFLIEVRNDNKLHKEIIANDVLLSMEYYDNMTIENKKAINEYLDSKLYFNNSGALSNMNTEIKRKLNRFKEDNYFYSYYSAIINCKLFDNRIEKDIIKELHICSYEESYNLKNMQLANIVCNKMENSYGIKEQSLKVWIDDCLCKPDMYSKEESIPDVAIEKKSGYDTKTLYTLDQPIMLNSKEAVKVKVSYTSVVPRTDMFTAIRMPVASKETNFQFHLNCNEEDYKKYKIVSCGFGFANNASASPNDENDPHNYNMFFKDWIFPTDGLVVAIQET